MRGPDLHRLSLVVCGLLISLPFLNPYHYYPFLTFYTEWLAFVIGLVALASIAMGSSRNTVPIPGMCIGLFVLTAVLVLQAALDQVAYPLRSAVGALYAIWAGLLVMLGAWLKSELGEAVVSRTLQWWLAVAGVVAAASAFVPFLRRSGHSQEAKRVLQLACLTFAVFLLVQVLNFYTGIFAGPEGRPNSSGERLIRYLEIDGGTGQRPIRIQLFLYAWLMFLSSPFFGIGFGEYAWHAFELSAGLQGPFPQGLDRHSHNLFLQLLAETGIAGLLCFAIPLACWLWRMPWRNLAPERCWAIGVLAVVGLHSMVEFPLWHANFLGMFALLFGMVSPGGVVVEPTRLRRGLVLVLVLAGILSARGVWSDYRAFERWYLALEAKSARGGIPGKSDLESLMELREGSLFGPYFERIASEAIALDESDLEDKLAFNTQVMRAYPMPSVVLRQIALLALSGRDAEALRTARAAMKIYPQGTREWMPTLEKLAHDRPAPFSRLLGLARAQLGEDRR